MEKPFFVVLLFALFAPLSGQSQDSQPIDLLKRFDPSRSVVFGDWTLSDGGLRVTQEKAARVSLLSNPPADYNLQIEFTREAGADSIAIILPVGNVSPALELSGWGGEAHGLSRVKGEPVKSPGNPTSTRPGILENGKRYQLDIAVRSSEKEPTVSARLNAKVLFDWTGLLADLQPNIVLNLPAPGALGFASHENSVVFHRAILTPFKTSPAPAPPATIPKKAAGEKDLIDLSALGATGTPGWEPFNGAAFTTTLENDRTIVRSQPAIGSQDRGAYLKGVQFSEGTIELDLKGSNKPQGSFLGIVFHGVDGKTYDSVYFRPFNFGSPDGSRRGHAVQYMSHPDFPWNKLRSERPEEFENPANPEPGSEDWFHAKVTVTEKRIRVFVNDAEVPCLDVEKLGEISSGKVGLWFNGEAAFSNLRISPEDQPTKLR